MAYIPLLYATQYLKKAVEFLTNYLKYDYVIAYVVSTLDIQGVNYVGDNREMGQ